MYFLLNATGCGDVWTCCAVISIGFINSVAFFKAFPSLTVVTAKSSFALRIAACLLHFSFN